MESGPKAIIFDLGNVLIDFNHRIAVRRISKFTGNGGEEIYNLFFDSELTGLFEEGKISPQQFFQEVKNKLNLKLNYEEFMPIWNEIFFFSEKNLEVYNLARGLKKHYRIALLSNINVLHFEYVEKTFPILDAFHNIITSFEVKARKPKKEIYQETLKILNASPKDTFYTDDRIELIESAKELGIRGFVFTNTEKLKKDLCKAGIKI